MGHRLWLGSLMAASAASCSQWRLSQPICAVQFLAIVRLHQRRKDLPRNSCGLGRGFFDFDFIAESSQALGKPRGSSFVIEAKQVDGAEFLVGHRIAHQVVSSG